MHKNRFYGLIGATFLIFALANKTDSNGHTFNIWGGVVFCFMFVWVFTSLLQKYFLGRDYKEHDNDSESFYVIMTMFVFGLGLLFSKLDSPPQRTEKDLKRICKFLSDNKLLSEDDFDAEGAKQEIYDICFDDPRRPEPDKDY
jgi:hypothetical protein